MDYYALQSALALLARDDDSNMDLNVYDERGLTYEITRVDPDEDGRGVVHIELREVGP